MPLRMILRAVMVEDGLEGLRLFLGILMRERDLHCGDNWRYNIGCVDLTVVLNRKNGV